MSKQRAKGLRNGYSMSYGPSGMPILRTEPHDTEAQLKIAHAELARERDRIMQEKAGARPIPLGKRSRTNDRTVVIKLAHQNAPFRNEQRSVFAALRALAQSTNPPAPLLGYDVDEESLKWDDGPDVPPAYQSKKDALSSHPIFAVKVELAMQELSDEALGTVRGRTAHAA